MTTDILQLSLLQFCPRFIEWDLPNNINFRFGKFMNKKTGARYAAGYVFLQEHMTSSLIFGGILCCSAFVFMLCSIN